MSMLNIFSHYQLVINSNKKDYLKYNYHTSIEIIANVESSFTQNIKEGLLSLIDPNKGDHVMNGIIKKSN